MARKTKKEFLENASRPELFRRTLNAGGVNWSDLVNYTSNYFDPYSGSVRGMIYYSDTEKFAKRNIEEILEVLWEYNEETGSDLFPRSSVLNWLAWFAWETMMHELDTYLNEY